MQLIRLVKPGTVDRVLAIDSLPQRLLTGIDQGDPKNMKFPKDWVSLWPVHYCLDYIRVNKDKERWSEIQQFVRRTVDPSFRLLDKLEDMAKPLAPDAKQALSLDAVDVPVIPIPVAYQERPPEMPAEPAPQVVVVPASAPISAVPVQTGNLKHTCENGGRGGRYAKPGECPRCDQLVQAKQLVTA